jgi:hypothetical protein
MPAFGQQGPSTNANKYNALIFAIQQQLLKVQTNIPVQVVSCTNSGAVASVGFVDVKVLTNQMTGNRTSIPHGTIFNIPYMRLQGGGNAVIMDPVAGDLGIMSVASRDISAVKSARGFANPGSYRVFNWSDGMYIPGILNAAPSQYLQFSSGGILLLSPTAITLQAPSITLDGNTEVEGTEHVTGAVQLDSTLNVTGTSTLAAVTAGAVAATSITTPSLTVSTGGSASFPSGSISDSALTSQSGVTPGAYLNVNLTVNAQGIITAIANGTGGGGGTVTSVAVSGTDFSISGSPITTAGTIALALAAQGGLTAGSYTNVNLTVNSKGVITAVANGSAGVGTVTSVGLASTDFSVSGSPVTSSGNITANLVVQGGVTPGTYTYASLTVNSKGIITAVANGTAPLTSVAVSDSITGTGVSGTPLLLVGDSASPGNTMLYGTNGSGTKGWYAQPTGASGANPSATVSGTVVNGSAATFMRSDAAPALANTSVTAGSYTTANITVDAQGRITSASNGSASPSLPGTIKDLLFWFESDNILANSGTIVPRLGDRTPYVGGLLASIVGGSTTYPLIDATQINSLNVVKFPGASAYTLASTISILTTATIFIVVNPGANVGSQSIMGGASSSLSFYLCSTTRALALVKSGASVIGTCSTLWSASTPFQANVTYLASTGAFAFRQARAAANSGTGTTLAGSGLTEFIGSDANLTTSTMNGSSIAALIVYNRVLSPTEIANMEAYLLAKWGV